MLTPLDARDRRLIAIVILVVVASGAFVWWNYEAAFPQASLRLPLSRDQILQRAEQFLRSRQMDPSGFRNLTLFDPDEQARLYLERELGLERANQLMSDAVPVWRWRARWFKPPDKDEFIVYLRPDGRLVGFTRLIKEAEAGARLEAAAAKTLAEEFLRSQSALPHKLISEQKEAKPNRDDHVFVWEQENFREKDATLRRLVVVQGGVVGSFREFLYVPEQWQRDFATLRSANELYASIAQGAYMLLVLASGVMVILSLRRREVAWVPLLRIAGVVAILYLLNELNTLPFAMDNMGTSSDYTTMQLLALLQSMGGAVFVLLYVLVPAAAGAAGYARTFSTQVPLQRAFTWPNLGTRSFFRSTLAGFAFAAGHLVFLSAFYIIGARFGVWSPQEVDYSDVLATPLPWIYPISVALMAATSEEFWFRLLGIPLLGRLVRSRGIAILVTAIVWGFLHANYPQQPGYIRGVEVGLIGVAAGVLMLRFGIVATLVWHYTIDALLIGLFLFRAEHWMYRLNGLVVALLILAPVIVSVFLYRRNRGFLPELETPPEAAAPAPVEIPSIEWAEPLPPILPRRYLYIAAAIGAALVLTPGPVEFGRFIRVPHPREEAIATAREEMKRRNLVSADWRVVADFIPNLDRDQFEYLRQQVGAERANGLYRTHLRHSVWRVRFFRVLQPEEWIFYVSQPDSAPLVYRTDHVLDEKAPGAQLETEAARRLAEQELHIPPSARLVDSQTDRRERRNDHSFVWEDDQIRAGDARLRMTAEVIGDVVCENRAYFKLPEEWLRDYHRPRLASYVLPALIGATALPLIIAFARRLGRAHLRWRVYGLLGALALLIGCLDTWNDWPAILRGYDTSTPLASYYGQVFTGRLTAILLNAAGVFGCMLAADVFLQSMAPGRRLPPFSWLKALSIAAVLAGTETASQWILQFMPGPRVDFPMSSLGGVDSFVPAFANWHGAIFGAIFAACLGAVYVTGALTLLNKRGLMIMAASVVAALAATQAVTWTQVPAALLCAVLVLGATALVVVTCSTDIISVGAGIFLAIAAGHIVRLGLGMSLSEPVLMIGLTVGTLLAVRWKS